MGGPGEIALTLAGVALVHFFGAASPGPSFVLVARTAAAASRARGLRMALGMGIGAAIWAAGAVLGLALLFETAPLLYDAMRLAGAAFLIWLAVTMWRHAESPLASDAAPAGGEAPLRHALMVQLSNPKVMVFFGSVFVGFVPPDAPAWMIAVILANVLIVEGGWYALVARVFSARRVRERYQRMKAWADRGFGTVMGALGLRLALG
ncbi:MAG: LysE family translocator [Pseudomonadota bacterium]